ncbi:hypothetical protein J5I95_06250 [Candidatus Poribacteria bacterium]|nr:hypothetical protein [Candidatus Poribacteria bacterium]
MFNFVFRRISFGILLLMVGLIPAHVATAGVEWGKSLEDGMKEAEKTGKPVMLDFYTDW